MIPSFLNVGLLINPSDVAFVTSPNAGVIGILHLIVSFKLIVLPDMPAPESTIQFDCTTCALFITTGAMNMDISVLSSEFESTAGSGSRTGVNSSVVLGPWVRTFPDDSVVPTVDGGDVGYDSVVSTVDGGDVGLYAGDSHSLPSVFSSALTCYNHTVLSSQVAVTWDVT